MTAVPGEPSPLRLRSSSASRAGTMIVTSINRIGSFDFRTAGRSTADTDVGHRSPARIPTQRAKLARITRQIDRATLKVEAPIRRTQAMTVHNSEVVATRSHKWIVGEHKVTGSMSSSPKLPASRNGRDLD